jgi:hypothetical protein
MSVLNQVLRTDTGQNCFHTVIKLKCLGRLSAISSIDALKRLVNHSVSNDMTGRYLILDLERLRSHMSRVSDAFIELLGINEFTLCDLQSIDELKPVEVFQLRLQLDGDQFL